MPDTADEVEIVEDRALTVEQLVAAHARERRALVAEIARLRANAGGEPLRLFTQDELEDVVRRRLGRQKRAHQRVLERVAEEIVATTVRQLREGSE